MEATSGQSSARTGMVGGGGARSGAGAYQTKHFSAVDSERHPIFLEFADSSLEQLYRVYAARRGIAYLRRTCLILLALLLAMTVMELTWAGSPWSADQVAVLSCRGLAVLWISIITLMIDPGWSPRRLRNSAICLFAGLSSTLVAASIMGSEVPLPAELSVDSGLWVQSGSGTFYVRSLTWWSSISDIAMTMAAHSSGLRYFHASTAALLHFALVSVTGLSQASEEDVFVGQAAFLLGLANVLATVMAYYAENASRSDFVHMRNVTADKRRRDELLSQMLPPRIKARLKDKNAAVTDPVYEGDSRRSSSGGEESGVVVFDAANSDAGTGEAGDPKDACPPTAPSRVDISGHPPLASPGPRGPQSARELGQRGGSRLAGGSLAPTLGGSSRPVPGAPKASARPLALREGSAHRKDSKVGPPRRGSTLASHGQQQFLISPGTEHEGKGLSGVALGPSHSRSNLALKPKKKAKKAFAVTEIKFKTRRRIIGEGQRGVTSLAFMHRQSFDDDGEAGGGVGSAGPTSSSLPRTPSVSSQHSALRARIQSVQSVHDVEDPGLLSIPTKAATFSAMEKKKLMRKGSHRGKFGAEASERFRRAPKKGRRDSAIDIIREALDPDEDEGSVCGPVPKSPQAQAAMSPRAALLARLDLTRYASDLKEVSVEDLLKRDAKVKQAEADDDLTSLPSGHHGVALGSSVIPAHPTQSGLELAASAVRKMSHKHFSMRGSANGSTFGGSSGGDGDEEEEDEAEARQRAEVALNAPPEDVHAPLGAQAEALNARVELAADINGVAFSHESVSVMFVYVEGLSSLAPGVSPVDLVRTLNDLYVLFDAETERCGVYKVMAIANMYLVVAGAPEPDPYHIIRVCDAADRFLAIAQQSQLHLGDAKVSIKMGINTGPVAAGVIGRRTFNYHIFGDTVNVASRMCSTAESMTVHLSRASADDLRDMDPQGWGQRLESRGKMEVKGKGLMETSRLVMPALQRPRLAQTKFSTGAGSGRQTSSAIDHVVSLIRRMASIFPGASNPSGTTAPMPTPQSSSAITPAAAASPGSARQQGDRTSAGLTRAQSHGSGGPTHSRNDAGAQASAGKPKSRSALWRSVSSTGAYPSAAVATGRRSSAPVFPRLLARADSKSAVPQAAAAGFAPGSLRHGARRGSRKAGRLSTHPVRGARPYIIPPPPTLRSMPGSRRAADEAAQRIRIERQHKLLLTFERRSAKGVRFMEHRYQASRERLEIRLASLILRVMAVIVLLLVLFLLIAAFPSDSADIVGWVAMHAGAALSPILGHLALLQLVVWPEARRVSLNEQRRQMGLEIHTKTLHVRRWLPSLTQGTMIFASLSNFTLLVAPMLLHGHFHRLTLAMLLMFGHGFLAIRAIHLAILNFSSCAIFMLMVGNSEHSTPDVFASLSCGVCFAAILTSFHAYSLEASQRRKYLIKRNAFDQATKCQRLLRNMLPSTSHVERLMRGDIIVETLPNVSLLYSDIVGFTKLSGELSHTQLIHLLHDLYTAFDTHLDDYEGLYKIETIGDAFIVIGGMTEAIRSQQTGGGAMLMPGGRLPTSAGKSCAQASAIALGGSAFKPSMGLSMGIGLGMGGDKISVEGAADDEGSLAAIEEEGDSARLSSGSEQQTARSDRTEPSEAEEGAETGKLRLSGPASAPERQVSRRRKSDPSDSERSAGRMGASPSMGSSGQSSNTPSALGSGSAGAPTVSVGPAGNGAPVTGAPASAPTSPEIGPGLDFGGIADSPANISHGDSFHLATMSARDSLRGAQTERGILRGSDTATQPSNRVQTGPPASPPAAPRINFQAQVSRGMRDHGMAAVRAVHGDIDFGVATEEELTAPPTPTRDRSASTHGILAHRHRGRSKSKPNGPSRKVEGGSERKPRAASATSARGLPLVPISPHDAAASRLEGGSRRSASPARAAPGPRRRSQPRRSLPSAPTPALGSTRSLRDSPSSRRQSASLSEAERKQATWTSVRRMSGLKDDDTSVPLEPPTEDEVAAAKRRMSGISRHRSGRSRGSSRDVRTSQGLGGKLQSLVIRAESDESSAVISSSQLSRNPAAAMCAFALDMVDEIYELKHAYGLPDFAMRIGIHVGSVVGGVIGTHRPRYFVWGPDTVIGNAMESGCPVGQVMLSAAAHQKVKVLEAFEFDTPRVVSVEGQPIDTVLLRGVGDRDVPLPGTSVQLSAAGEPVLKMPPVAKGADKAPPAPPRKPIVPDRDLKAEASHKSGPPRPPPAPHGKVKLQAKKPSPPAGRSPGMPELHLPAAAKDKTDFEARAVGHIEFPGDEIPAVLESKSMFVNQMSTIYSDGSVDGKLEEEPSAASE
ncbi:hypothetical protein FNF27_04029 [Cafeteria roenbergensis]|uniref:Guanylate cyclase domain-containing protein n=1 Tax=Cafeteria roenbergensis TaxID=33653 RepID=A0A5A8EF45_CAFRO|nr:hypothetical protein FNF27_04029 [Cafeteria roenbergensis]